MRNDLDWRQSHGERDNQLLVELQHSMETHFSPHHVIHLLITPSLIAHTGAVQTNHHYLCVCVCVRVCAPVLCCVLLPPLLVLWGLSDVLAGGMMSPLSPKCLNVVCATRKSNWTFPLAWGMESVWCFYVWYWEVMGCSWVLWWWYGLLTSPSSPSPKHTSLANQVA